MSVLSVASAVARVIRQKTAKNIEHIATDVKLALGPILFKKQVRGRGISTCVLPHQDVNLALPETSIYVDGKFFSAN